MHAKLAIAAVTIVILTSAFFVGKTRLSAWQPCAEACSLGAFRLRNRDLPLADFLPRFSSDPHNSGVLYGEEHDRRFIAPSLASAIAPQLALFACYWNAFLFSR
jgi:hypothetical protein